jgi:protein O-GlcNAc transferase
MKKVISYSLWGQNPLYTINAIKNCEIAMELFPDWICRFYLNTSVPQNIISHLQKQKNSELVYMNGDQDYGMLWRFNAASDLSVGVMISRDADSLLNERDSAAVQCWLNSNKMFHIMRDHTCHSVKIMAGMWGAKQGILNDMTTLIDNFLIHHKQKYKQKDQDFLATVIYPKVIHTSLVHDPLKRHGIGEEFPIPRKRPWRENIPAHILQHLNSVERKDRKPEYKNYDDGYDNDFIGKLASITEEDIERYS